MDENATNAEEMQPPYVSLPICTIFPPPISKLMRQVWKCLCFESLYLPRVMVASVTPNKRGHTDLCRFGGEIYLLRIDSGKKLHCNILWFLCFHTVLCVVTVNITTSQPRAVWPLVQYFYKPNSFSNSISFPWQLKVVTKSLFCVFWENHCRP